MDAEARFRALYAQSYGPLHRWAQHRGITGADADDLVADVFTIAWRRFADIPADAAVAWLFGVARNVARNRGRAERRRAALHLMAPRDASTPPPDEPSDTRVLRAALDALRSDDREVLRLVAWDGVELADLPVALGCSPGAARVRLHRARQRFAAAVTRAEHATGSGRDLQEVPDVR
ncbi:MAG TPA: sigma-70 family RNA polymerase sigma factor [Acidimicrobiales bacterium]|nr:sigma-70 family RNA polymerase sigma factor [Acidimicrobiales bacterium]